MRILIIGAGDVGMPIIHYLSGKGNILTVIEKDEKKCKHISDHADAAIFHGSGSDIEIWKTIEAEKMDALMALTNDDEVNMGAIVIAKGQYGIPLVIARARQPENIPIMKEMGADIIICPSLETRRLFLNALESPTTETLCDYAIADFKTIIVTIPMDGRVIGKTLDKLRMGKGCRVVAVVRNYEFMFPTRPFVLMGGDRVLVIGSRECVEKTSDELREIEQA